MRVVHQAWKKLEKKIKKQRILELKEAIKKAEAEWNTSDVEKLKKELRGLTNESFLTKIFKSDGRY